MWSIALNNSAGRFIKVISIAATSLLQPFISGPRVTAIGRFHCSSKFAIAIVLTKQTMGVTVIIRVIIPGSKVTVQEKVGRLKPPQPPPFLRPCTAFSYNLIRLKQLTYDFFQPISTSKRVIKRLNKASLYSRLYNFNFIWHFN